MSATNITFAGFSLQDSTYRTENITYRHLANKTIDEKEEPRRGGFDVVDTFYSRKEIRVSGWIMAATKQNLRVAVDNLKKNLREPEQDLDIEYGDNMIRYSATVSSMEVNEEHHHITRIPFTINFLCQPWGTDTAPIEDSKTISSTPFNNSINIVGSYGPFPVIRWTASGTPSTTFSKIKFNNTTTGDFIEVDGISLSANGHYLEIDIKNMTVTENGTTAKDFDGVFPSFAPSTNSYSTTFTGNGTLIQKITYYPTYL